MRARDLDLAPLRRVLAVGGLLFGLLAAPLALAQDAAAANSASDCRGLIGVAGCAMREVGGNMADAAGSAWRFGGRMLGRIVGESTPASAPTLSAPPPVVAVGPPPPPPPRFQTKRFDLTTPLGAVALTPADQVQVELAAAYALADHASRVLIETKPVAGDIRAEATRALLIAKGVAEATIASDPGQALAEGAIRVSVFF